MPYSPLLEFQFFLHAQFAWLNALGPGVDEPHTVYRFASALAAANGLRGDGRSLRVATGFVHQNTKVDFRSQQRSHATREAGDLLIVTTIIEPNLPPERRALLLQAKMAPTSKSFLSVGTSKSALEQHYLYRAWPLFWYSWPDDRRRVRRLNWKQMRSGAQYLLIPPLGSRGQISGYSGGFSAMLWRLGSTAIPTGANQLTAHSPFLTGLTDLSRPSGKEYLPGDLSSDWHGFVDDMLAKAFSTAYPRGGANRGHGSLGLRTVRDTGNLEWHSNDDGDLLPDDAWEGGDMTVIRITVVSDEADFPYDERRG